MDRGEFFGRLAPLDEERLRKALWNLYWRGSAAMRQRIEAETDPDPQARRRAPAKPPVDAERVLEEVRDFVGLARSGAYIGGDRRVSPRERTRGRFTFRRLVADARDAVASADATESGVGAMELLIDLAAGMRAYDYFRSEDPVESARFVVSEAAELLWRKVLHRHVFAWFADRAAPQLVRWEARYGWTRTGFEFAAHYLEALDRVACEDAERPRHLSLTHDWDRGRRTGNLAEWHAMLLDKLLDYGREDLLDRLSSHPALGGPELTYVQATLAHRRGDLDAARGLIGQCLQSLPGHDAFRDLAIEVGAPLPSLSGIARAESVPGHV